MVGALPILAAALSGVAPDLPRPPAPDVEFTIYLNDALGNPVPDALVSYGPEGVRLRTTRTDEAGTISATFSAERIRDRFEVRVGEPDSQGPGWPLVLSHSGFEPLYEVLLPGGADRYEITIDAFPTVQISGRLTDELGAGAAALVTCLGAGTGGEPVATNPRTGTFCCEGVRRDETAHFFCAFTDGYSPHTLWRDFRIGPAHTREDQDIGDVPLPLPRADAHVRIDLGTPPARAGTVPMISLWEATGAFVISAQTRIHAPSVSDTGATLIDIPLPAGTYYAFGRFAPNPGRVGVLEALRAGRAHVLDELGVPRITVEPGDDRVIVLDKRTRTWDRRALEQRLALPDSTRRAGVPGRALSTN